MEKRISRKLVVLLLTLCISVLVGFCMLNGNFRTTSASADTVTSSIEESLTFNLFNNGTEYRVSARNKQITDVSIPAMFNGLPITEIMDNGFTNCTNLKNVQLPYTIKRIGNNAFANCKNLEVINGMPRVENIGNNAFAMCTKLDNLILPSTINKLGSTILRNNSNTVYSRLKEDEMTSLNANWKSNSTAIYIYGNDLVLNEVRDENDVLKGYNIAEYQNIITDEDYVLGDTYEGFPILEIEQYAFNYCIFNSFTLKHGEIIEDDEVSSELAAAPISEDCEHTVNISSGAFFSVTADYIDLLVDITFNDDGVISDIGYTNEPSTDVFSCSSIQSITLPNNINYIPQSAFSGCENLREIKNVDPNVDVNHISDKINSIGSFAFVQCKSISDLYIPGSVTTMGETVFSDWGDSDVKQILHFIDLYELPFDVNGNILEGYNWKKDWKGKTRTNFEIDFKKLTVKLNKDGGKEGVGTDIVKATYNKDMPDGATAPEKDYFTFEGYFSELERNGTQYYDSKMKSVTPWDKKADGEIFAGWLGFPYKVTLNPNGGTGGTAEVTANYRSKMPSEKTAPIRTGYDFTGYFYDLTDENTKYYNDNMTSAQKWDKHYDAELMAGWENRTYDVILKYGKKEETLHNVTYDKDMPSANIPILEGYTFYGYFTEEDGNGTPYYDADMNSKRPWDIDEQNVVLYAHMKKCHTLTFDPTGGNADITEVKNLHYQDALPKATAPTRDGYEFLGYFDAPLDAGKENYIKYYDANMNRRRDYDVDRDLTLYAHWTDIKTIYVYSATDFLNITDKKVKLVFLSAFSTACKIYTGSETTYLELCGKGNTYNMNLRILGTEDFELRLDNINMIAHSKAYAIQVLHDIKLNLYTSGNVTIKGYTPTTSSETSISAICCYSLYIHSADALCIEGGDGMDGKSYPFDWTTVSNTVGGTGGNAAPGITAYSDVYINCSNVTISGGTGGRGGNGFTYGLGGKGAEPIVFTLDTVTVHILDGTTNVNLVPPKNGEHGKGVQGPLTNPGGNIGGGIINPGFGGGDIIIPQPPVLPPVS